MPEEQKQQFDQHCVVELMGHVSLAGRVTEETVFGTVMMRVDVPAVNDKEGFTQYIGGGALYRVSPVTEEAARVYMERRTYEPPIPWDVKRQLTAAPALDESDYAAVGSNALRDADTDGSHRPNDECDGDDDDDEDDGEFREESRGGDTGDEFLSI